MPNIVLTTKEKGLQAKLESIYKKAVEDEENGKD